MDENIGAVSGENSSFTEAGGISFSGGKDNEFIKKYAASPQIDRTIEDIEKDELKVAEKQAEIRERNAQRREKSKNKENRRFAFGENKVIPEASKPASNPSKENPSDSEELKEQPDNISADPPLKKKLTRADLIIPISDDDIKDEAPPSTPEEKKQLSRFARIFSESKGFSVFTLITGMILVIWNVLYIVTAIMRDILFTNAVNTMLAQGQINYTAVFSSPALSVLKFMAYIIPILILAWIFSFKKSDGKNKLYNKKTMIIIMCLIAFSAVVAVFDVASAHLVMA